MNINISRSSNDPFYRYKMPALQTADESGRTLLANLDQIARALCRDPEHILKYIGTSLGCSQIKSTGGYALNGRFEQRRLQALIYDFIDIFVLCPACGNPETCFVLRDGLQRVCNSCGAVSTQEAHKLNAAILKNVEKGVNADTKYSKSKGSDVRALIESSDDASERILDLCKEEGLGLADLFAEYFKPSGLKQLRAVLAEHQLPEILECIEDMLESSKKEEKIESFLKALLKLGHTVDGIDAYFRTARKGKKRSPLIKKNAAYFIDNCE
ncbi:translation initiation factor 5 [Pancytospora philotis]|nr:translation initiation factor 5 [Pancytospora philotis]